MILFATANKPLAETPTKYRIQYLVELFTSHHIVEFGTMGNEYFSIFFCIFLSIWRGLTSMRFLMHKYRNKTDIEVAKTREAVYPMTFNLRATSKIRLEITVTSAISMPFKAYWRMSPILLEKCEYKTQINTDSRESMSCICIVLKYPIPWRIITHAII